MTDPRKTADDTAFERELAEAARAYRAADGSAAPPPSMDDAIRAAARRAVQAAPRPMQKPWLLRFSKPLSVAAVLVLTASLLIVSFEERPELAPPMAEKVGKIALPALRDKAPATAPAAGADAVVQSGRVAEEAPPAAPPSANVAARRMELAPMPELARRTDSAERQVSQAEVKIAAPAPPAAPAYAPPAPPPSQIAAPPMPAPAIAPPTDANRAELARERRDNAAPVALARKEAAAPAMPAPAVPAPRAAAGAATGNLPAEMKQAVPIQRSPVTAVAADSAATISPQAAPAPALKVAGDTANLAKAAEPPEAWLKRIIELRQQMKSKEADEELARFRKRYPGYVIPPELKAATGNR